MQRVFLPSVALVAILSPTVFLQSLHASFLSRRSSAGDVVDAVKRKWAVERSEREARQRASNIEKLYPHVCLKCGEPNAASQADARRASARCGDLAVEKAEILGKHDTLDTRVGAGLTQLERKISLLHAEVDSVKMENDTLKMTDAGQKAVIGHLGEKMKTLKQDRDNADALKALTAERLGQMDQIARHNVDLCGRIEHHRGSGSALEAEVLALRRANKELQGGITQVHRELADERVAHSRSRERNLELERVNRDQAEMLRQVGAAVNRIGARGRF
jgi:chromosome segregation ATPase